jgi:hypothetical protein
MSPEDEVVETQEDEAASACDACPEAVDEEVGLTRARLALTVIGRLHPGPVSETDNSSSHDYLPATMQGALNAAFIAACNHLAAYFEGYTPGPCDGGDDA